MTDCRRFCIPAAEYKHGMHKIISAHNTQAECLAACECASSSNGGGTSSSNGGGSGGAGGTSSSNGGNSGSSGSAGGTSSSNGGNSGSSGSAGGTVGNGQVVAELFQSGYSQCAGEQTKNGNYGSFSSVIFNTGGINGNTRFQLTNYTAENITAVPLNFAWKYTYSSGSTIEQVNLEATGITTIVEINPTTGAEIGTPQPFELTAGDPGMRFLIPPMHRIIMQSGPFPAPEWWAVGTCGPSASQWDFSISWGPEWPTE